jgi:hypothetical protein
MQTISLDTAAQLTTTIVMVATLLGAGELLLSPAALRSNGFYSWDVLRTQHAWAVGGRLAAPAARVFGEPGIQIVLAVQAAAAGLAIARIGPPAAWIAVALAGNLALHLRNTYGLDGSDQMQTVVLSGLLLYYAAPDDTGRKIALGFIAAQSMLSYFSAGYAKLISPMWRDGSAVMGVLDTQSYGNARATRIIRRWPAVSKAACWSTLVFECLMPLLVLTGPTGCLVFIVAGLAFHLGIAATMGLNLFFWSFAATYPCLYLLSTWVH